jgi:ABC-2 type transport system permease protein
MTQDEQVFWEYLNYGLALLILIIVALVVRQHRQSKNQKYAQLLAS